MKSREFKCLIYILKRVAYQNILGNQLAKVINNFLIVKLIALLVFSLSLAAFDTFPKFSTLPYKQTLYFFISIQSSST